MGDSRRRNRSLTKKDFCLYCHTLYERELVTGVGGNLSVRVGGEIFITPSGLSLRDMTEDRVVTVNEEGKVLGEGTPTKDADLHVGILVKRGDIHVVCHLHGANIIAASSLLGPGPSSLSPVTPGFVYFAYPLPMIPFMVPGSKELADAVTRPFQDPACRALLLQNHGLVTVGGSFHEALNIAEEIDEAAKIYLLTRGRGRVISDEKIGTIKSLRTT